MQTPFRPKQIMKQLLQVDEPLYLTPEGIAKLERRLKTIVQTDLPQAIEDVRRTGEFGDFSENAEYQEAKARMRRLHDSVASIKDKLKTAIVIERPSGENEVIQMGSSVLLKMPNGGEKRFHIVGPHEADPVKGHLSYKSPLGAKLMGRAKGEEIEIKMPTGEIIYTIISME